MPFATLRAASMAAALTLSSLTAAQAGVLYANDNFDLYRVDQTTGVGTLVGNMVSSTSGQVVIDMTASASTLYGLVQEQVGSVLQTRIATIDTSTGAVTLNPLISGIFAGSGVARRIDTIAYDLTTGTLYGVNNGPDRSLYRIDATSGVATRVGAVSTLGLAAAYQYRALAFDDSGVLFGALSELGTTASGPATLVRIDAATGATTLVGSTGVISVADLVWDADDDTLYGGGFVQGASSSEAALYTLNPGSAAASLVGISSTAPLWAGLAVLPGTGAVPLPGTLTLALAGLLALGLRRQA